MEKIKVTLLFTLETTGTVTESRLSCMHKAEGPVFGNSIYFNASLQQL